MKKIVFFVLMFIYNPLYTTQPDVSLVNNSQQTVIILLKPWIARFFIGGVSLWALGEILTDMGHRYLYCKEEAMEYAKELRYDGRHLLTEGEISFWSLIQGLSAVPRIWWREFTATALTIAFIQIARQMLLKKPSAMPKA